MKTNKSVIAIYLEKDIEDMKLLAEINNISQDLTTKEFARKFPKLFELKQHLQVKEMQG